MVMSQTSARGARAAARRHSGHRQVAPACGIGKRTGSALHQHAPSGSHANGAPQRVHTMRVSMMVEGACTAALCAATIAMKRERGVAGGGDGQLFKEAHIIDFVN